MDIIKIAPIKEIIVTMPGFLIVEHVLTIDITQVCITTLVLTPQVNDFVSDIFKIQKIIKVITL